MTESPNNGDTSMFLEGSFGGLSGGDEAYPNYISHQTTRVYYVGASRRVYAMRELLAAMLLVLAVALLGIAVVNSVENRTEQSATTST